MPELTCTIPVPRTPQELDQAIQRYRNTDLHGYELFCQWQAICEGSMQQDFSDSSADAVPGEDSY